VLEREVDHSIRCGSCTPQAVEVVNGAATHLRPGGGQSGGRGIRASQPDDLMTPADELGHDSGADPAGCTRYENAHERPPSVDIPRFRGRLMSVTAISIALDVSHCHRVRSRRG